jgi:hypothetical protein
MNILKNEDSDDYFIVFVSDTIKDIIEVVSKTSNLTNSLKETCSKSIFEDPDLRIKDIIDTLGAKKVLSIPEKQSHKFIILNLKEKINA